MHVTTDSEKWKGGSNNQCSSSFSLTEYSMVFSATMCTRELFVSSREMVCLCVLSCVWLFVAPWTVACQAPLSMEFSRQECWSGLPFPIPGYLPDPGIEPASSALQVDSLPLASPEKLMCVNIYIHIYIYIHTWTESAGRLQSKGLQRVRHDWATKHAHISIKISACNHL